ncbi:hypothetical protein P9112_009876 [Eukaryota sp. TZLM1-RC]
MPRSRGSRSSSGRIQFGGSGPSSTGTSHSGGMTFRIQHLKACPITMAVSLLFITIGVLFILFLPYSTPFDEQMIAKSSWSFPYDNGYTSLRFAEDVADMLDVYNCPTEVFQPPLVKSHDNFDIYLRYQTTHDFFFMNLVEGSHIIVDAGHVSWQLSLYVVENVEKWRHSNDNYVAHCQGTECPSKWTFAPPTTGVYYLIFKRNGDLNLEIQATIEYHLKIHDFSQCTKSCSVSPSSYSCAVESVSSTDLAVLHWHGDEFLWVKRSYPKIVFWMNVTAAIFFSGVLLFLGSLCVFGCRVTKMEIMNEVGQS